MKLDNEVQLFAKTWNVIICHVRCELKKSHATFTNKFLMQKMLHLSLLKVLKH